ncbi:small serum protein 2-like isoform X2 [Heteronotia binoei]|nr:small serum protein 2-like isoform X2 [Heteronotia binoei]
MKAQGGKDTGCIFHLVTPQPKGSKDSITMPLDLKFYENTDSPHTFYVCIDPYNGSKQAFGSKWNTSECMTCSCDHEGLGCCTRYGGVAFVPGCKATVDKEAHEYKFYKANDPSKPCF